MKENTLANHLPHFKIFSDYQRLLVPSQNHDWLFDPQGVGLTSMTKGPKQGRITSRIETSANNHLDCLKGTFFHFFFFLFFFYKEMKLITDILADSPVLISCNQEI